MNSYENLAKVQCQNEHRGNRSIKGASSGTPRPALFFFSFLREGGEY